MKKTLTKAISLALCAAMLLGYALVPGMLSTARAETPATNLLTNASFESGPEAIKDWEFYTTNTQTQYTDEYKKSGKLAVSFAAKDDTAAGGILQTVTGITAGTEYTISAYTFAKGTAITERRIAYAFNDAAGTSLASANIQVKATEEDGWKLGTITVTAPENAATLTVRIYTTRGKVDTIYVDDVSVTAAGSTENLVKNPGFETYANQLPGWYAGTPSDTYISSGSVTAADGSKVLEINKLNAQVTSTPVAAEAGKTYTASIQAHGTEGIRADMYIRFLDAEKNTLNQQRKSTTATTWSTLTVASVAPEGTAYVQLVLVAKGADTATAWYFDNAMLTVEGSASTESGNGQEPVVPGVADYEIIISDRNLIRNPLFEKTYVDDATGVKKTVTTLEGWGNTSNGVELTKAENQSDKDAVGNYMLKINDNSNTTAYQPYYNLPVKPGQYTFSVMIRGEYTSGRPEMLIQGYKDLECKEPANILDKVGNSVSSIKQKVTVTKNAWTCGTYTFTVPDDVVCLRLSLNSAKASLGWAYFGSVSLVESMDNKFINLNFEYTDDKGNVEDWQSFDNAAISVSKDTVAAGVNALKVTDNSATAHQGAISDLTDLSGYQIRDYATSNLYHTVTARVKDAPGVKGKLSIVYYDNKYLNVGETTALSDGSGTWQFLKAEGKAPERALYAEIVLQVGDNAAATGTVYFDDLTVTGDHREYVEETFDWNIKYTPGGRLYYTDEELKQIKEFIKDESVNAFGVSGAEAFADLLQDAEKIMQEKSYVMHWDAQDDRTTEYVVNLETLEDPNAAPELRNKPGGRSWPYLEGISNGIRDRMQTLALAYALTGDTRYADKAIGWVLDMCDWEYWAETDYVWAGRFNSVLDCPRLVVGVSTVYDMCYDRMTKEQRQRIEENIIHKGLSPLYFDLTGPTGYVAHNKYMARCSGLMAGALAIINDENKAIVSKYLDRAYSFTQWYLDSQYKTGDQEGYSYTHTSIEEIMMGMSNMSRVTGREGLLNHPYFDEILVDWVVDFLAPGSSEFPAYSDTYTSGFFKSTMLILNSQTGNGKAGYYLQKTGLDKDPFKALLLTSANTVITPPTENDYVAFVEKIGYGGLRTGWDDDDMMLYIIGNNSKLNHNQFEQLTFLIASESYWLAADPGYESTDFGKQYGHNTILVDNNPQLILGEGKLNQIIDSKLYGYLQGSAPGAYGAGTLTQFDRHAIMINHGDRPYYVLIDELDSEDRHVYDWTLNTGSWTALTIDGKPLDRNSSTTGNKIAVDGNGGRLYAEFVSKKPMNISTVTYPGDDNNIVIHVNGGKTKTQQYMTILNKAYGSAGDDEYSFIPLLNTPEKVQYKTSNTTNPEIVKSVAVKGVPLYFFRGEKAGDWIEWPFVAEETGNFEVVLKTAKNYNYGIYKIYIDGKYVATYDGYDPKVGVYFFSLGKMDITAGEHTLKLELVGSNSTISGMLISMSSIIFRSGKTEMDPSPIYAQEIYDTKQVLGAKIFHNAVNSDIVLFNRGTGKISAGGVTTDGKQASIIGLMTDGYMEGFAAMNATSLVLNGKNLMQASKPATVSADLRGKAAFTVTTDEAQTVSLYTPSKVVSAVVDGKTVDFTVSGGMASIALSAGTHTVQLKVTSATAYEYSENGDSTSTTTYDANGMIVYQHIKNADGTEYLFKDGKVYLNVYVSEETNLLVREELGENGDLTITYYDMIGNVSKVEVMHVDGNLTTIKSAADGSVTTTVTDSKGNALEITMEYADGTKSKAEYLEDRTVSTKWDKDGNLTSITTLYKDGRRVDEVYNTNGTLASLTTIYKDGKRVVETYDADEKLVSVITSYKGGDREEVTYNADGTVVTNTYKAKELVSVHTKYANGTAVLVEYLENGGVRTTKYDASGNVIEVLVEGVPEEPEQQEKKDNSWLWIGIVVGVVAVVGGAVTVIYFTKIRKKNEETSENEE